MSRESIYVKIFIMKTITKTKSNKIVIIFAIVASVMILTATIGFLLYQNSLSKALKELDINQKPTVVRVLKRAKNSESVLLDIAKQYDDAKNKVASVQIALYILQSINPNCTEAKEYVLPEQIPNKAKDFEFEIVTRHGDAGYGGVDGVYCSDFDGNIVYKISPLRPLSLLADENGVFALDSTDNTLKHISITGDKTEIIKKAVCEFVFKNGNLYYIGTDGVLYTPTLAITEQDKIIANIRIQNDSVLYDVYDKAYNLLTTNTVY